MLVIFKAALYLKAEVLMAVRDMQEELRHFLSARTERNVVL
jgi:hypothetical protein